MPGLKPESSRYTVTRVAEPTQEQAERIWEIYEVSAAGLGVLAAARHVMTRDEFDELSTNPDVIKVLAVDEDGGAAGMALLTTDLDSVEWISPGFFRRLYPEHAERGALYYLAFIAVHPDQRGIGLLPMIIFEMASQIASLGGVCCFDVCQFNDEVVPVKEMGSVLMHDTLAFEIRPIDTQRWYVVDFTVEN